MVNANGRKLVAGVASCLGLMLVGVAGAPAHADSIRSQQWHLDAMQADEMWKTSTGAGVTVAVIDSGVDPNIPTLKGQVLDGKDFSGYKGDEHDDYDGHGTGIASIVAGTGDGIGKRAIYGLAPGVKILPLRVPQGTTAGTAAEQTGQFARTVSMAVRYAADSDAKVINIALATDLPSSEQKQLAEAVRYAMSKDALVFAGVGNDGDEDNRTLYPAATPGVVGMAAMDRDGKATGESQNGAQVDLAAPGEEIIAACPGKSGACVTHGTSDATALASASAALIWSKHPEWSANQILRVMINTAGGADSGKERTDFVGYGAVRPRVALKSPGDPGPADVYPIAGEFPSAAPSPEPSDAKGEAPQAADEGGGSGDTALWIALGLGAAALLGGGVAASVVVSRRRRAAVAAAQYPVPPMQMPYQPGSAPWPGSGQYSGPALGQPGQIPGQYPAPYPGATPPPPPGAPYPYHGGQGPQ